VTLTVGVAQALGLGADRPLSLLADTYSSERLATYDDRGRTIPKLLDHWTVSDDRRVWRLSLRPGVVFQDGTPLTSADIQDAIRLNASTPGAGTVCLPDIDGIDLQGDLELVVRLKRPCSFLLDDIDTTPTRTDKNDRTYGTGPFRIESVSAAGDRVTMVANPHYYGGPPAIDSLVFRAFSTLRAPWAEMMRGQVDLLLDVGPDSVEFLQDQDSLDIRKAPALMGMSMALNLTSPTFKSADVRTALNQAVNREELVREGLKGHGRPADVPVWPSLWAFKADEPGIPYDPVQAHARLDRRAQPLTFTCLLPQNYAVQERLALLVQRQLRAVGVDMRLESLPPAELIDRFGTGRFEAVMLDPVGGPYLASFYRFWHSPDPDPRWNQFGYRDGAVDRALEDLKAARDDAAAVAAFGRFVAALRQNPPGVVLVWPDRTQAISRRFETPPDLRGTDVSRSLATWKLRRPAP
jgi:peptide/nickel transport system substrate-binding protein